MLLHFLRCAQVLFTLRVLGFTSFLSSRISFAAQVYTGDGGATWKLSGGCSIWLSQTVAPCNHVIPTHYAPHYYTNKMSKPFRGPEANASGAG